MNRILLSLALIPFVAVSCGTAAVVEEGTSSSDNEISVGYGSVSKNAQAFSVDEMKVNEGDEMIFDNIYDFLREKAPGVEVSNASEGANPKIIIRGSKNVWGNNPDPLFVLDEKIIPDISVLRPEQIYSVQVLKDAAASAYGSRSSNGVILFKSVFAHDSEVREAELRKQAKLEKKQSKKNK